MMEYLRQLGLTDEQLAGAQEVARMMQSQETTDAINDMVASFRECEKEHGRDAALWVIAYNITVDTMHPSNVGLAGNIVAMLVNEIDVLRHATETL